MIDIGSPELLMLMVVALLVLGPERLPEAIRSFTRVWGRLRRSAEKALAQIQEEIGFDRIRQQLDEEGVLSEIESMQIELNELKSGSGVSLTEIEKPAESGDPRHWPGMPPDQRTL